MVTSVPLRYNVLDRHKNSYVVANGGEIVGLLDDEVS